MGLPRINKQGFTYYEWQKLDPMIKDKNPDCGYNKKFDYNCFLNTNGVMYPSIEWAIENCQSKWGWWFTPDENQAVMSFEDPNELALWTLKWYNKQHRE